MGPGRDSNESRLHLANNLLHENFLYGHEFALIRHERELEKVLHGAAGLGVGGGSWRRGRRHSWGGSWQGNWRGSWVAEWEAGYGAGIEVAAFGANVANSSNHLLCASRSPNNGNAVDAADAIDTRIGKRGGAGGHINCC